MQARVGFLLRTKGREGEGVGKGGETYQFTVCCWVRALTWDVGSKVQGSGPSGAEQGLEMGSPIPLHPWSMP